MSESKDGGPAFPLPVASMGTPTCDPGMSLRDYFAAQALAAMTISETRILNLHDGIQGGMLEATAAYVIADAMLKARGQ